MNDKKAAINIYITNEKRKITNTDLFEYGISGFGGICEKDKNTNIVIACAHYKYDFGLKPPKYEQIFPSIATHGLVSLNINYSKGPSLNDVRSFLKILDPPSPPCQMKSDLADPP